MATVSTVPSTISPRTSERLVNKIKLGGAVENIRASFQRKDIPVSKEFRVGPIDKWRRYRRVPCKLTLNVLMCILLTLQVYLYVEQHNKIIWESTKAVSHHFLPPQAYSRSEAIFPNVTSLVHFVNYTVHRYYDLHHIFPGVFLNHTGRKPPELTAHYRNKIHQTPTHEGEEPDKEIQCALTYNNPLGPFTPIKKGHEPPDDPCMGVPSMEYKTEEVHVRLYFQSHPLPPQAVSNLAICYDWTVTQKYMFDWEHAGILKMQLQTSYADCSTREAGAVVTSAMAVLACSVGLFSIWDLFLRWRSFKRSQTIAKFRTIAQHMNTEIRGMTLSWFVFCIIADCINLVGVSLTLYCLFYPEDSAVAVAWTLMLGSSCMCTWFVLLSYLQHAARFYLLLNTLKTALPKGLNFLVAAAPIFFAYALFGMVVFGDTAFFASIDISTVTLFAVLNGDSVDATFITTHASNNKFVAFISRIYCYSFVSFFIFVVLNIFLVIIEEAYGTVQEQRRLHNASAATTPATASPGGHGFYGSMSNWSNPWGASVRAKPINDEQTSIPSEDGYQQQTNAGKSLFNAWDDSQDHVSPRSINSTGSLHHPLLHGSSVD
eukprot:TRINITY_DN64079_c0_g1_i1.p1 TRINITY_DN64079_c0_g1~~TRINITY_DN64079_c0_g1_i1.p1  ORF type:complete len:616 (-),score=13.60 TRINITY_DN64079_c0_g1_i1:319-2121(-)